MRRILLNSLYFLEVKADGQIFYKIGITTRLIEERIAEVQRDVKVHYSDVVVNLLGLWESRGNVELYFKHRYKAFNYRIGKLTEYFQFPNIKPILRDLFEMEAKVPSEVELDVLTDRLKLGSFAVAMTFMSAVGDRGDRGRSKYPDCRRQCAPRNRFFFPCLVWV